MTAQSTGLVIGVFTYLWWGLSPLYWAQLSSIDPGSIIAHRALWGIPFLLVILFWTGTMGKTLAILRNIKLMGVLFISAGMISINWGLFVWSAGHGHLLQSSLGYFMLPLVNIITGMLFFSEKANTMQWVAIACAAVGVAFAVIMAEGLTWIAITVAVTFGIYGALRKAVPVGAVEGLFIETLLMSPFALFWLSQNDWGGLPSSQNTVTLLLLGSGLMTIIPLMGYVAAARRLPLFAVGMLFYMNPSLQFLVAWLALGEVVTFIETIAFILVLSGLAVYTVDQYQGYLRRQKRPPQVNATRP